MVKAIYYLRRLILWTKLRFQNCFLLFSAHTHVLNTVATLIGAIGAVVAAVFAMTTFYEIRQQTFIAKKSLAEANRPWLDIGVDLSGTSLIWNDFTASKINLPLRLVNKGHSPALNVASYVSLITGYTYQLAKIPEIYSACYNNVLNKMFERILFMDEMYVSQSSVDFGPSTQTYYKNIASDPAKYAPKNGQPQLIHVVACAVYRIPGDDIFHHTARVFNFGKTVMLSNGTSGWAPIVIGEDIPEGHASVQEEFQGNYAD